MDGNKRTGLLPALVFPRSYWGLQKRVTEAADLWGRLATCGGLTTCLPKLAKTRRTAPVANRRAGFQPASQNL